MMLHAGKCGAFFCILFFVITLIIRHLAYPAGLFPCLAPSREILIHQGMEAGIMTGL